MHKQVYCLENWELDHGGSIDRRAHGRVYGHPKFHDAQQITTSKVLWASEHVIETQNSIYILRAPLQKDSPEMSEAGNTCDDPVNHPSHYTQGAVECIDAIESALGREGFIAFLRGQVIKYNWRMNAKGNPEQDAQKASWYQKRLVETQHKGD